MNDQRKWKCENCDEISLEKDLLEAVNPFDADQTINGCPTCKGVFGFTEICDEPGCVRDANCGFPTPEGYRRTCGDHMRAAEQKMQPTPGTARGPVLTLTDDDIEAISKI